MTQTIGENDKPKDNNMASILQIFSFSCKISMTVNLMAIVLYFFAFVLLTHCWKPIGYLVGPLDKNALSKIIFLLSTKTYVLGAHKNKVGNWPVNMHIDQTSGHYWF